MTSNSEQIILGIDPGTRITGYGVIRANSRQYAALDYGCIRPPAKQKLSDRYLIIYEGILELIELHQPHVVVVETQYVYKNVKSAITLGMARGAVIIAAKKKELPIFEYSPTKTKKAVVGTGTASKLQIGFMIQKLLGLSSVPKPEDAADALALAICHTHTAEHLLQTFEI